MACANGGDTDARTNLALGSLMAGAAFSNAMVGIVHSIGHSLGGLCHIPHGQAMMMLLPHCVKFNLDRGIHAGQYGQLLPYLAPEKAAELGANATAAQRDEAMRASLFALNAFFHDTYGVPLTLAELGVSRDALPAVASKPATTARPCITPPKSPWRMPQPFWRQSMNKQTFESVADVEAAAQKLRDFHATGTPAHVPYRREALVR